MDKSKVRRLGRPIATAIACSVMALVLPSCGIPQLHRPEPGPAIPPTFNGAANEASSSQLGVSQFYNDPMLLCLIEAALANNRELKILTEQVVIAENEILARSGAYRPFLTAGPAVGLYRVSNRTIEGAAIRDDEFLPGRFFTNPFGNYLAGADLLWHLDIYGQLHKAQYAAERRHIEAMERRNYFVTRLVADIATNYYTLMGLDKRIENLDQIIAYLEQGLEMSQSRKEFARDTELAVQRFEAEIRRNKSEKLVINQEIIETENRINFLIMRFPQHVERSTDGFFDLQINSLSLGVPSQLLQNRPDIRQAERELEAAGLDVEVARANFYPQLFLNAAVGIQSFYMSYLFNPQAVLGNVAGSFVGPLVNRRAIRAEYLSNAAMQRQAIYDYQRTIVNAFTEVINRITAVQNYSRSVLLKKEQLASLERAVQVATDLYLLARADYLDVLTVQRDLRDARMALIDIKVQELVAVVDTYQALGGGTMWLTPFDESVLGPVPFYHTVRAGENFWTISNRYYKSGRYYNALWSANQKTVPAIDGLALGDKIVIPRLNQLDPALVENGPEPPDPKLPVVPPAAEPPARLDLPPAGMPGPFERNPVDPVAPQADDGADIPALPSPREAPR